MAYAGIDLQRISLGALIIALGLLVDDAMTTVETMITRLEQGDDKEDAATFAYTIDRVSDADRHARHRRGLRADRLRRAARPANTPSRSSPWSRIALIVVVVRRRPVRAAARRLAAARRRSEHAPAEPGRRDADIPPRSSSSPCGRAG